MVNLNQKTVAIPIIITKWQYKQNWETTSRVNPAVVQTQSDRTYHFVHEFPSFFHGPDLQWLFRGPTASWIASIKPKIRPFGVSSSPPGFLPFWVEFAIWNLSSLKGKKSLVGHENTYATVNRLTCTHYILLHQWEQNPGSQIPLFNSVWIFHSQSLHTTHRFRSSGLRSVLGTLRVKDASFSHGKEWRFD